MTCNGMNSLSSLTFQLTGLNFQGCFRPLPLSDPRQYNALDLSNERRLALFHYRII